MGCLGNIIWFLFGGFVNALGWFIIGLLWCISIIGIPVGLQCFKMAQLQLAPFGREVVTVDNGAGNFLLNILWLVFGGVALAISNVICAFLFAVTIIGIPFAIQFMKMAKLSLMPFGKEIV
ncbi:YccF domain-containing protein [Bacillus sp. AGMB 02131]|uniref:YccF domain-containing protein n=1 Tax=Peribacillus faecalis TaxID=2772559 RepID=A0A927HBP4_9BACI|nr:YccF domain-containing protein [Peribacillus faecalis]MBD3108802.1 YccF domain-containing protein [Peribacillus faecalis]